MRPSTCAASCSSTTCRATAGAECCGKWSRSRGTPRSRPLEDQGSKWSLGGQFRPRSPCRQGAPDGRDDISGAHWRRSGEEQLRDLDGVQRCALAQIVIAHEQGQAAVTVDAGILPDPAYVARILPSGLERSGYVRQGNARG